MTLSTIKDNLGRAFLSISIGEERVLNSYSDARTIIESKKQQLKGIIPFTLRDELEVNRRILQYSDACISQISMMQRITGLSKLEFPIYHDLLRIYRNRNHHVGYFSFRPMRSTLEIIDFFIWPILVQMEEVKESYPEWCKIPDRSTLSDLIEKNHEYVISLIEQEKRKFKIDGIKFIFKSEYHLGDIHFGPINIPVKWDFEKH